MGTLDCVSSKYLSKRAFGIHLALIGWIAMCGFATWWQVQRAAQGNSLSYLYAIEWPVFFVLGFMGWYALLNADQVSEHHERARREYEDRMRAEAQQAREEVNEDETLKAYNDHLADLSSKPKKKLFGH